MLLSFREMKKTAKSKFGIDDEAVFFQKKTLHSKNFMRKIFFTLKSKIFFA
jgi:hypothetical protein